MHYGFLVPGILLLMTGVFPLSTAKTCNYGAPDISIGSQISFTSQAVTHQGVEIGIVTFGVRGQDGDLLVACRGKGHMLDSPVRYAFAVRNQALTL